MKAKMRILVYPAIIAAVLPFLGFVNVQYVEKRDFIIKKYKNVKPHKWGMYIPGVKKRINTEKKIVALTFDACGGTQGKEFDKELIEYLKANGIPATLFVTTSWIGYNEKDFKSLTAEPLFEIENHGFSHKPASVTGASAWKIRGTRDAGDCYDEVEKSAEELEKRTGRRPLFYRSGTAYFDDVSVNIVRETGQTPMTFSCVTADGDKHLTLERVKGFFWAKVNPGTVFIMHFNHPGGKTFPLVKSVIPKLKEMGYSFVKLQDYSDQLM